MRFFKTNFVFMKKKEIATAFSHGVFEKTFEHLADDVTWEVVGEKHFSGKEAIVKQCKEVAQYFESVTTRFETLRVIEDDDSVVVTGTGEFLRDGARISFVQACDVYVFDKDRKLQSIASYCIQAK